MRGAGAEEGAGGAAPAQLAEQVARRVADVRRRIAEAARRAGRDPGEVVLLAVSKNVTPGVILAAARAGVADFGENRVQELMAKVGAVDAPVRWHFVGQLQTNKVRYLVDVVDSIHSLDRLALAEEIDRRYRAKGRVAEVLVEVNVAGEATKTGLPVDEVPAFVAEMGRFSGLRVAGLMTIAPATDDPEMVRPVFREVAALARRLRAAGHGWAPVTGLSMGMSGDFEVAVEEGATIVRVGTAIFGPRSPRA